MPNIAEQAVFDPAKAKDYLAKAGYPEGKGFPEVEIWYREEGGYNGAIIPPMLQYLQAQFKDILGITMNIKSMPAKDWMEALLKRKNNLFLAPYEYDYLDPSNFYGIFYNGGRHNYHNADYDKLVKEADSSLDWDDACEALRAGRAGVDRQRHDRAARPPGHDGGGQRQARRRRHRSPTSSASPRSTGWPLLLHPRAARAQ